MISRLRRNAELGADVLSSMAHPEPHPASTLDAIVDADMILEALDDETADYQNITYEPDVGPDATSMYDIGMSGSAVDEEPTTTRPSVLTLVEFPCPLCHQPVVAEQHRGHLRVPGHQILAPIYPHGFGGPLFRAECPASGMPITEMCTGSHRPPSCSDPRCLIEDEAPSPSPSGDDRVPTDAWPADERTAEGRAYPADPEDP